jgi:SAM-dependent methyltransferase
MQEIVYHTNYKLENEYWWFVARNQIVKTIFNKYVKPDKNKQILDFGIGTGGFAAQLKDDYNVLGLDMSKTALEYSEKRGIKNLIHGMLSDMPKDKYDIQAITALDVIEHIENDTEITKELFDILTIDGYLIATVPAYQWMWSKHDEIHMHYRRYSRNKFNQLLENAGFKIVYSSNFNSFLFLPAYLKRMLDRITGAEKKITEPVEEVSPLLNQIFTNIFLAEKDILKEFSMPFGLSIITVAKKQDLK